MQTALARVFLLFFAILLSACESSEAPGARSVAAPPDECTLVMGWDPWEPYQYANAHGDIVGLDIEIAQAAASASGCRLSFVEGPWMELLNRLRAGEVHVLAGATRTPGREAFAEFTEPYRSESFVVYTLAENIALREVAALDALLASGARLGSVREYYYGEAISVVLDQLAVAGRLKEAPLAALNYERLRAGEIDAFIEDPFVASSFLRKHRGGARRADGHHH